MSPLVSMQAIWEAAPLDVGFFVKEATKEMRTLAENMRADYRNVVRTWNHKPGFNIWGPRMSGGDLVVTIAPTGANAKIFHWVDKGTKPHVIPKARKSYPLKYQKYYKRKTSPGSLWSGAGGKYGPWRSPYQVTHPGITPGLFSERIAINHIDWWQGRVAGLMQRFAAKS